MAYELVPEQMYHPFGGMNPDANGIMLRHNEAVDVVNVQVTSSTVNPRSGTRYITDIIWEAELTVTNAETEVNRVYGREGDADAPINTQVYRSGELYIYVETDDTDPDNILRRWVVTENEQILLFYTAWQPGSTGPVAMSGWFQFDGQPSALTVTHTFVGALPEIPVKFHTYVHPVDGTIVFAFCEKGIYQFIGGDWLKCWEDLNGVFDQWSVTNYIDKTVGATTVAAGSIYTPPAESYVEGPARVLLYYDPATKLFDTLQLTSDELAEDVFDVTITGTAPHIYTSSLSMTPIIAGSVYFVMGTDGVICNTGLRTFEQPTGTAQYLLAIDNSGRFVEGVNSWINLDTGVFSIEFNEVITAEELLCLYSYEQPVDYKPLGVVNFHNALVIYNTYEPDSASNKYYGWRTRWTQPNDMNTVLQRDYQELALSDISPILVALPLETAASSNIFGPLYFYKHNSIVRGTYNQNYGLDPNLPVPLFSFEIAYSEGIEAINTLISVNGIHMYLGRNDVYKFDGYNRVSATEDRETRNTRVQKELFDQLNLDELNRCFGFWDEIGRNYYLFFTEYGSGSVYPIQAYLYETDRDTWVRMTVPPTSAGLSVDVAPLGTIARLNGPIEGLEGTINSLTSNLSKLIILAMPDLVYYAVGSGGPDRQGVFDDPIDSYFITRDFYGQTLEENDRAEKVMIEAKGDSINIAWNGDYSKIPANFKEEDILRFGTIYIRETYHPDPVTTAIRYLVRLNGATEFRWLQSFSIKQEFSNE